eukprot:CAMPEP_0168520614 /NCGR_PEP_ID=MMETSP0405-20121227/8130_1 /TAXON_ID=498012 /ORGANISM="Trichosphaerium sp, Strain Am-I-7 wt" /LENGTH=178 /DNA_ID=CAMNT_0008541605 /DNA_START=35 /DNA_END=567 /DNA_ORIENTATION=-
MTDPITGAPPHFFDGSSMYKDWEQYRKEMALSSHSRASSASATKLELEGFISIIRNDPFSRKEDIEHVVSEVESMPLKTTFSYAYAGLQDKPKVYFTSIRVVKYINPKSGDVVCDYSKLRFSYEKLVEQPKVSTSSTMMSIALGAVGFGAIAFTAAAPFSIIAVSAVVGGAAVGAAGR